MIMMVEAIKQNLFMNIMFRFLEKILITENAL